MDRSSHSGSRIVRLVVKSTAVLACMVGLYMALHSLGMGMPGLPVRDSKADAMQKWNLFGIHLPFTPSQDPPTKEESLAMDLKTFEICPKINEAVIASEKGFESTVTRTLSHSPVCTSDLRNAACGDLLTDKVTEVMFSQMQVATGYTSAQTTLKGAEEKMDEALKKGKGDLLDEISSQVEAAKKNRDSFKDMQGVIKKVLHYVAAPVVAKIQEQIPEEDADFEKKKKLMEGFTNENLEKEFFKKINAFVSKEVEGLIGKEVVKFCPSAEQKWEDFSGLRSVLQADSVSDETKRALTRLWLHSAQVHHENRVFRGQVVDLAQKMSESQLDSLRAHVEQERHCFALVWCAFFGLAALFIASRVQSPWSVAGQRAGSNREMEMDITSGESSALVQI